MTWRTISLTTEYVDGVSFISAIERRRNMFVGAWARDILTRPGFEATAKSRTVDLVRVCHADLGLPSSARFGEVFQRAVASGLALCSPDVAPHLRLQYHAQPRGEWFFVAMPPLLDSAGYELLFELRHDNLGLALEASHGSDESVWLDGCEWVFETRSRVTGQ
jgi:hypothetical protein